MICCHHRCRSPLHVPPSHRPNGAANQLIAWQSGANRRRLLSVGDPADVAVSRRGRRSGSADPTCPEGTLACPRRASGARSIHACGDGAVPGAVALGRQRFSDGLGGVDAPDGELVGSRVWVRPQSPNMLCEACGWPAARRHPARCGSGRGREDAASRRSPGNRCLRRAAAARPPSHWPPRSPTISPSMPVSVSVSVSSSAGSGKGRLALCTASSRPPPSRRCRRTPIRRPRR